MNIFRLIGDLLHVLSFIILFLKIRSHRSCAGISLKSQELYAIVFTARYVDIFWNFSSKYNMIMKLIFLGSTYWLIYIIRYKYRATYDKEHDTFRNVFLIAPCLLIALVFNKEFTIVEILWAFSLYLEAVAILPQLFLLQRTNEVENLTSHYIFTLGGYRAFYLLNWIYRVITEPGFTEWIVWISGTVQTALFCDFFYYYLTSKWYGKKLTLPQ
eukprot:Phypoly_transcript_16868.p1 GENE.Phypoly_transcript_16868~~Phypoly_transcript_16868.p1  ORF type:complete len:214 (+),score=17.10 Phypoly_transcript_16868:141-782(+)